VGEDTTGMVRRRRVPSRVNGPGQSHSDAGTAVSRSTVIHSVIGFRLREG
jgi:hypothetical protein